MAEAPVEAAQPVPSVEPTENTEPVTSTTNGASSEVKESLAEPNTSEEAPQATSSASNGEAKGSSDVKRSVEGDEINGNSTKPSERKGYQGKGPQSTKKERYRLNNKFDPLAAGTSDDPDEIRKQVEFYFSDSNLPMDKFLLAQVGGVENKPVQIKTIHNFKRMRRFQPFEAVVAALKESKILDVTADECIQRKVPIEPAALGKSVEEGQKWVEDKTLSRSIYAKGFGQETPTTQFDIEAFFASYGPTNAIRLRRDPWGTFKTSVFVEFADDATQEAFMALEPKPTWKGKELMWKSKKAYVEDKAADMAAGRIKPPPSYGNKRGRADQDDWKKRREEDQKRGFKEDGGHRSSRGGHGRGSGGRGGRGGHPRGRGGKHHHRDRDAPKSRDHDEEKDATKGAETTTADDTANADAAGESKVAATTAAETRAGESSKVEESKEATSTKKRPREEEEGRGGGGGGGGGSGTAEEPPAKKADLKTD